MRRNLKITLSYDGSDFHGWQVQPGKLTIQGALAEAFLTLTHEQVLPQGSGRTDAGVHALAQVASLSTESHIPTANFTKALNGVLPPTIRALKVEEATEGFHARHSAKAKTYEYRIFRGEIVPPFLFRYVYHYPYPVMEEVMVEAAKAVIGEHDFTSFAAVDPDRTARMAAEGEDLPHNIRTIYSSEFEKRGEELVYRVRGNGFLHHMVRNLVGTFLLAGKGTITAKDVATVLAAKNRTAAGATAPGCGLYLVSVEY